MLLASPMRLPEAPDVELEFQLPEGLARIYALGRVVREAGEVGWPYLGYGVEFLFVPDESLDAIGQLVDRAVPPAPLAASEGRGVLATVRRGAGSTRSSSPLPTRGAVSPRSVAATGGLEAGRGRSLLRRRGRLRRGRGSGRSRLRESSGVTAETPRVCVLLPVNDAAATLPECLASLRAQTLPDHEVVAVDDGSSDGSAALLERAAAQDSRVRVVHAEAPGLVAALNTGLRAARAPLVARMDADDVAHEERLRLQVEALQGDGAPDILGSRVTVLGGTANAGMRAYVDWSNALLADEAIRRDLFVESPLVHPSVTMRTRVLHALGGYRAYDGPEDYDLWLRAAALGARFAKLEEPLLLWRDSPARPMAATGWRGWQATTATRASERASMRGCLPIGPSLPSNGHRMSCSEPEVASTLAVRASRRASAPAPNSPTCACAWPSASRQPCSVGSCMAVTRKRPSGLKVDGEMRALPFEPLRRGAWRVGKPERDAVVMRDREPQALWARRRARATVDGASRLRGSPLPVRTMRGLAGRPGDRAVGAERDLVDPALLGVGRERLRARRRRRSRPPCRRRRR